MSLSRDAGRSGNDDFKADAPGPTGRDYLFVVGIDAYEHCPRLYNAVKDAKDFIRLMTEKYQFSEDGLFSLFNETATQTNIYHTLDDLQKRIREGDSLLIYFSGHGEYKENIEEGFWIPVDGRSEQMGTQVSFSMIKRYLKKLPTLHTLVIADSCYSGSFFTGGRSTSRAKEKLATIPSRWVLTAGRNEIVADGQPGENSPFASSLLSHLNRNDEPLVSISELTNFVTITVSGNTENDQIPRGEPIAGVGHEGGEFVFRLKGIAGPVLNDVPEVRRPPGPKSPPDAETGTTPTEKSNKMESLDDIKRDLKRKIGDGRLEEVFERFYKIVKPGGRVEDDAILQEGQYNRLKRDRQNGMIGDDYANRTLNRISAALKSMVDDLSNDDLRPGLFSANAGPSPSASASALTPTERQGLENQLDITTRRLNAVRESLATAYDPNIKFALEEQVKKMELEINELKRKLNS